MAELGSPELLAPVIVLTLIVVLIWVVWRGLDTIAAGVRSIFDR